jgi:hypothetical protein
MYADTFIAVHITITDCVGVVDVKVRDWGGHKTLEHVHRLCGDVEHVDLGFSLPCNDIEMPDRYLTEAERLGVEYEIQSVYEDLVQPENPLGDSTEFTSKHDLFY